MGICVDGECAPRADTGADDRLVPDSDCAPLCGAGCCDEDEVCVADRCARDEGPCAVDGDCVNDSFCEPDMARCIGFGPPDRHECTLPATPGILAPELLCEWRGPPAGDAFPAYRQVKSLPLVVDFHIGRGPDDPVQPSIVLTTSDDAGRSGEPAVIRVLDGATCAQQHTLGDVFVVASSTLALGDLTGDGRAEIVGHAHGGGVAAWSWDGAAFSLLWRNTEGATAGSLDMVIADLDDDGTPEVIAAGSVYGADGRLLSTIAEPGPSGCGGGIRGSTVVADVDRDGRVELVSDTMIYEWSAATSELMPEPYFTGPGRAGYIALADFGRFPAAAGDGPETPEVVVVSGSVTLHTIGGEIVYGPVVLPGGQHGGNPTVADFDGDGAPEIGVAGLVEFTVFDPRCGDDALPGTCGSGRTDGILWSRSSIENSCAVMGSTVFDFEGDGRAEVVYADQCFLRIFDGVTGEVVWSHPNGSGTWEEAPVVADVDGDFHADLLLPSVDYPPSGGCPALDPDHAGSRCGEDADCPASGGGCVAGLCRCETAADCDDPALDCAAPIDGSAGNVCRSAFRDLPVGLQVFRDRRGRWASSRPVWNQHGYFIDNVGPTGVVPRSSALPAHWLGDGLNSFRQNSQTDVPPDSAADLTVRGESYGRECRPEMPELPLSAEVCNRGALPVGPGVAAAFFDDAGVEVCRATTSAMLAPGECETVTCTWTDPPVSMPLAITIEVDSDASVAECVEGNNGGSLVAQCPPPVG